MEIKRRRYEQIEREAAMEKEREKQREMHREIQREGNTYRERNKRESE